MLIRFQVNRIPAQSVDVKEKWIVNVSGISTITSFFERSNTTCKDKIFPRGNRRSHNARHVPLRNLMSDFWIYPFIFLDIVNHDVRVLRSKAPSTENHELRFVCHHRSWVSTTRIRRITLRFKFSPLVIFRIQWIQIVECQSLIIDTTMSTKDKDFILIKSCGMAISWLRSSNLRLCVLWFSSTDLIGRFTPLKGGC